MVPIGVEARDLCYSYGQRRVLDQIAFSLQPGEVTALLGPNGAGKSTLLGCLLGYRAPQQGAVLLDGCDVRRLSPRRLSQKIAYVPQASLSVFSYTVLECVLMGATGQLGLLGSPGPDQEKRAMDTLDMLGIGHLRHRSCLEISGGERQLMLMARALVQQASVLVLDEPAASLDYGNAHRVMEHVAALGRAGYIVLFSTHQPEHAFRYATRALVLSGGVLLGDGEPGQVLTRDMLTRLYSIPVSVLQAETKKGIEYMIFPEGEE